MTMLKAIWHDLIEKKLWLVAVPLLALIVAVPFALGRPGEPEVAQVPPPVVDTDDGPSLALTSTETTSFKRAARVNRRALDPFARRSDRGLEKTVDELAEGADAVIDAGTGGGGGDAGGGMPGGPVGGGDTGGSSTGGGGTGGGGGDTPSEPKPKTELDDVLSFLYEEGKSEPIDAEDVPTLSPLPDVEDPFLVYVGKTKNGKASFLVSADVSVSGQGDCSPSKADCRTLELAVGETADFALNHKKGDDGLVPTARFTVTDIERKRIVVDGGAADSGDPLAIGARARVVGAKALKSVLDDDTVVRALRRQQIKIRH